MLRFLCHSSKGFVTFLACFMFVLIPIRLRWLKFHTTKSKNLKIFQDPEEMENYVTITTPALHSLSFMQSAFSPIEKISLKQKSSHKTWLCKWWQKNSHDSSKRRNFYCCSIGSHSRSLTTFLQQQSSSRSPCDCSLQRKTMKKRENYT